MTASSWLLAVQLLATPMLAGAAVPDCSPQTQVDVARIDRQIVLIGETHGTEEIPRFAAGLVCSLLRDGRPVMMALEYPSSEQPALNRYVTSQGSAEDRDALTSGRMWHSSFQFGVTSRAMFGLIESVRSLRQQGQRVALLALDRDADVDVAQNAADDQPLSAADNLLASRIRDRAMADRLLGRAVLYRNYTIVSLTGSYHASNVRSTPSDPDYLPMGYWIERQQPAFIVGFDAVPGTAWVCTNSGCGAQARPGGRLTLDGARIDALVPLRSMTASQPAVVTAAP